VFLGEDDEVAADGVIAGLADPPALRGDDRGPARREHVLSAVPAPAAEAVRGAASEVVRAGDRKHANGNQLLNGADLGHALRDAERTSAATATLMTAEPQTGPLALLVGPTFVESWIGASSVGQAALLLVVLAVLLGVPALLGFVTARATRPTASEPVLATAWLCDGTVVHGRARPPSSTVAGTWTFEDAEVIRRGERWRSERVVVPDDRLSALSTATVIAALTAPRLGGRR